MRIHVPVGKLPHFRRTQSRASRQNGVSSPQFIERKLADFNARRQLRTYARFADAVTVIAPLVNVPLENVTAPLSAPAGLALCPIFPNTAGQIFTLAVAVADHRGAPRLVMVRSTLDARVYLAALCDASGQVKEWLELWVQSIGGLAKSATAHRELLSNSRLDEVWKRRVESLRVVDRDGLFETGWEEKPAPPVFLDLAARKAVSPADPATGDTAILCRDDALLARSGLPAYSASLHRYWQTTGASARVVCAATPDAPVAEGVAKTFDAFPELRSLLPLNPEGGRLCVRRYSPLALDEFSDLVGGKSWKGIVEAREQPVLEPVYQGLQDWEHLVQAGQHLLIANRNRAALLCETLHLKLRLLIEATESVRARVKASQLPFLNLSDRSFRVELADAGSPGGMPTLWTARVRPALPSQAYALAVKSTTARHFLALESPASSLYRPQMLAVPVRGAGQVRVRRIAKNTGDETVIEGTLLTSERLNSAANDLVWIQFPLGDGRYDLFATIDYAEGLAKGEARFRTLPQVIAPEAIALLKSAEGVPYADTPFETIPMLSTPCDLYALGMLGARIFLCNSRTSMGVVADELLSLARQLGLEHDAAIPLGQRVRQTIERDPRLLESLGPHRLLHADLTPADALASLPATLWWDLLGTLARFLPGLGPDAFCKDFGDVTPYQLDAVFEKPLDELRLLLTRSRSLLLIDWTQNREIAQQVQRAFEMSLF